MGVVTRCIIGIERNSPLVLADRQFELSAFEINFAEEPMSLRVVAVKRNCLLSEVLSLLQGFGAKFGPAELRRS